jgi:hypothetical protein
MKTIFLILLIVLINTKTYVIKSNFTNERYKNIYIPQCQRYVEQGFYFNYNVMVYPFSNFYEYDTLDICEGKNNNKIIRFI